MIKEVHLKRFKRFENEVIPIKANNLTVCAGPNSSGKSTLLHALAVWAFGIMVVRQFKGDSALFEGYSGQGAGLSDDDFTPINIPDLRHLWYNLKSQIPNEGYSMSITVKWDDKSQENCLSMAFSLVQDRLYIKAEKSNLSKESALPRIVYVPPVAGLDAREEYATQAKRRAMLGRGLAGAVLRNFLFDLETKSKKDLRDAQGTRARLPQEERKKFNKSDPWERLNAYSREIFGFELRASPFNANFHTIIRVEVVPKKWSGSRWHNSGAPRDLMVEGSGAQQWLTVLTFALSPETDVLLLDEPDAHLFTGLKRELIDHLEEISRTGPQILLATHSTEILKRYQIDRVLNFSGKHPKYLMQESQRARLISGLGDDYAPLIEKAMSSRAILFVENESDARILSIIANICGMQWPKDLAILPTTDQHNDRLKFFRKLLSSIDGLKAVSIRDRDNIFLNNIDAYTLCDKGLKNDDCLEFLPLTWRRREIENYILVASALIRTKDEHTVKHWWQNRGWAWPQDMSIDEHLIECDIKKPLKELLGKSSVEDVFKKIEFVEIHDDLKIVANRISQMSK